MRNNRDYYKRIISLYEATENQNNSEINQNQLEIADSGEDVLPAVNIDNNKTPVEEVNNAENFELDDANYLANEPLQDVSIESVMEKQRLEKLFDLFNSLLNYSKLFYESLVNINSEMISDEKKSMFIKYVSNVKEISNKINEYLIKIYPTDKYERILYTYILLRTEFLTSVKELRSILELNKLEEDK